LNLFLCTEHWGLRLSIATRLKGKQVWNGLVCEISFHGFWKYFIVKVGWKCRSDLKTCWLSVIKTNNFCRYKHWFKHDMTPHGRKFQLPNLIYWLFILTLRFWLIFIKFCSWKQQKSSIFIVDPDWLDNGPCQIILFPATFFPITIFKIKKLISKLIDVVETPDFKYSKEGFCLTVFWIPGFFLFMFKSKSSKENTQ